MFCAPERNRRIQRRPVEMGRYSGETNPLALSLRVTVCFIVGVRVRFGVRFPRREVLLRQPHRLSHHRKGSGWISDSRCLSNQLCYILKMQSCRFAFAVHVMAVLAMEKADCCPSSRLAQTVNTNPVVIRRLLIELQEAGLISTLRGPTAAHF